MLAPIFTAYWLVVLGLDAQATLPQQIVLGLTTFALLVAALCLSPPAERVQVVSMVAVATCCECIASLAIGLYRYRLDNLPLYVPPGHGLFFLLAVRLADLAWLQRHRWLVVTVVVGGSVLLLGRGLTLMPRPDVFGLLTWVAFVPFVIFSRYRLLYAVSFTQTMALEFYGTALGLWAWAPIVPLLGVPAGNPPAAIGAGYCVMDCLARAVAPTIERPLRALRERCRFSPSLWERPALSASADEPGEGESRSSAILHYGLMRRCPAASISPARVKSPSIMIRASSRYCSGQCPSS